jgi:hypothetical protein
MNELELIRKFRSDVPYPDMSTTAAARARVLGSGRPARRRARWPFALAATAAAAAAVLVVVLVQTGTPQSAAAAVLKRTARTAADQPGTAPPRPGQFVYTRTHSLDESTSVLHGHAFSVLVHQNRESWIGTDGSGRLREATSGAMFMSGRDHREWIAAGRPKLSEHGHTDQALGRGELSYMDLSKLPTDPDALKAVIEQRKIVGGPPGDAETFTIVGDLLRETYASPQLRAALYRVVAELPRVVLLGETRDDTGRAGISVAYSKDGLRHELIFDPRTSALLGEVYTRDGKTVGWSVYLASAVVDSTSAKP